MWRRIRPQVNRLASRGQTRFRWLIWPKIVFKNHFWSKAYWKNNALIHPEKTKSPQKSGKIDYRFNTTFFGVYLLRKYRYSYSSGVSVPSVGNVQKHRYEFPYPSFSVTVTWETYLPQIDWMTQSSTRPAAHSCHTFIETIQECFLFQHVLCPTRYRHGETPSTLDLIFSEEEVMVRELEYLPGLGNSDPVVLQFTVACSPLAGDHSMVLPDRINFNQLSDALQDIDWSLMAVMLMSASKLKLWKHPGMLIHDPGAKNMRMLTSTWIARHSSWGKKEVALEHLLPYPEPAWPRPL